MAGTSWDKLGQMEAAFEIVAPALRRVAQEERAKLQEFHNEDPVWRFAFARNVGGEGRVDVSWHESAPDTYHVNAAWWLDDYDTAMRRLHEEPIGDFRREQPLEELEQLVRDALARVDSWNEQNLDRESGPYPDWQKYQTREDFYRTRLPKR